MFIEIILSNQNTKNIYKNAARSASRKFLQIAFQDAKKHKQKQTTGGSCLMRISLLQISLLRLFKKIHKFT